MVELEQTAVSVLLLSSLYWSTDLFRSWVGLYVTFTALVLGELQLSLIVKVSYLNHFS